MKIAILAAGSSLYFPFPFDKPKSLYHVNGEIQLEKVIESAKKIVDESNIIVVAGYKYWLIKNYLKKYPKICLKVNKKYNKQAIYSFLKAIENENDDMVFMFADETISDKNIQRIAISEKEMSILCHDNYYYYSLGIFKLRKDKLHLLNNKDYLDWNYIKRIYCFANNKTVFDGRFNINSGVCIGYIIIDLIRIIGNIEKVENPILSYKGNEVDFLHYCPEKEYIPDIDNYSYTDEYNANSLLTFYYKTIFKIVRRAFLLLKNYFYL